jgi:hypothetical protein
MISAGRIKEPPGRIKIDNVTAVKSRTQGLHWLFRFD